MDATGHDTCFKLMAAPLQGFTEAPFRHFHALGYGNDKEDTIYFSPFIRMEKGEVRNRDIRDITSSLNGNHTLVPQVIADGAVEFAALVDAVAASGYGCVDLNAGCPFVPQVRKGRGAGLLRLSDRMAAIAGVMREHPHITFSLKMRLGVELPDEWEPLSDIINSMDLSHITLHPRTAAQQYRGELHMEQFARFCQAIRHPVVFNGEIAAPDDISRLRDSYPGLYGVMAGRGLLRRPSLFAEYRSGREWDDLLMRSRIKELHGGIFRYYSSCLCGDTQLLVKIKPLWEYFGACFPRKQIKAILKSHSVAAYQACVEKL